MSRDMEEERDVEFMGSINMFGFPGTTFKSKALSASDE